MCLLARDGRSSSAPPRRSRPSGDAGVETYACDVRSKADVERVIAEILERQSGIDVLVNNAGIIQVGPLEHMKTEDFENAMATHFWGPLYLMQACLPAMKRRGFGRIVNISSIGGRIAVPHLAPYSASKFALVGLSDAVRAEVARHGIRVTTVSPGLMRTGSPDQRRVQGAARSASSPGSRSRTRSRACRSAAERAARQIIDACRYGDPELTIGLPAKVGCAGVRARAEPSFAEMMAWSCAACPDPAGAERRSARSRERTRDRPGRRRW